MKKATGALVLVAGVVFAFAGCTGSDEVFGGNAGSDASTDSAADSSKADAAPDSEDPNATKVTVDTYNIALAGAFIQYENERRPALVDEISKLDSDFLCVQEAWRESDKQLLIDGAKAKFPYAVSVKTDQDTAVDDPTGSDGGVPAPYTTAPCGGQKQKDALAAALSCVAKNCSTEAGSDTGQTTSTGCVTKNCVGTVLPLMTGTADDKRCYACMAVNFPVSTIKDIATECTQNVNAGLAFGGQSSVVLLSKHPLTNVEHLVLPSTWNRRIVLRATATLPNKALLDVYCHHLTPIFHNTTLYPYTGQYGTWDEEQLLEAQKLIAWVKARSGTNRAVVAGDYNSGREYKVGDKIVAAAEGSPTMELLEAAFPAAIVPGYTPACTYCTSSNPLATDGSDVWIDHILLKGIDVSAVRSTQRTYVDPVISVNPETDGGAAIVPLSDHYGLRSTFMLSP